MDGCEDGVGAEPSVRHLRREIDHAYATGIGTLSSALLIVCLLLLLLTFPYSSTLPLLPAHVRSHHWLAGLLADGQAPL